MKFHGELWVLEEFDQLGAHIHHGLHPHGLLVGQLVLLILGAPLQVRPRVVLQHQLGVDRRLKELVLRFAL